ncbi:MAG TPA: hypothetical protein VNU46_07170 [Gemmatimonadaceae bacterium]|nr:hypothetical protein [Gemmatimonadaceae bacterium]
MHAAVDTNLFMTLIGWIGALSVLVPYACLSLGRMTGDSIWYQGLNAFGSLLLIINTVYNRSYPSTAVNVVWVIIAAYALTRKWRRQP